MNPLNGTEYSRRGFIGALLGGATLGGKAIAAAQKNRLQPRPPLTAADEAFLEDLAPLLVRVDNSSWCWPLI